MSLADVAYQFNAQRHVQRAIRHGRLPHAYLFHGPDGVGKETFARGLAGLLLCEHPGDVTIDGSDPHQQEAGTLRVGCGMCEDCRSVRAFSHPDMHVIFRQLSREHPDSTVRKRKALDIGVDVLRHFLINCAGKTPTRGRAKVFVVREADRITPQAQNALLKTLEEPAGNTIIILLVTSLERLLPTTLSRCQTVRFDALPTAFVQQEIAKANPDLAPQEVDWYARISSGSIGQALNLIHSDVHELNSRLLEGLSNSKSAANRGIAFDPKSWIDESKSLLTIYKKQDAEISDTEAGRRALKSLMDLTSAWYADVVLAACEATSKITNLEYQDVIIQTAARMPIKRAIWAVNRLSSASKQLDQNANTQLCIETLINDLKRLN